LPCSANAGAKLDHVGGQIVACAFTIAGSLRAWLAACALLMSVSPAAADTQDRLRGLCRVTVRRADYE
jgi:hypothetical protein